MSTTRARVGAGDRADRGRDRADSDVRTLVGGPTNDSHVAISPDGSKILFTRDADAPFEGASPDIYLMNADGSGLKNLTNDPGSDFDAPFSPDGMKIGFTRDADGPDPSGLESGTGDERSDIWVMNLDGSGQTNLTNTPDADEYTPAWGVVPTELPANPSDTKRACEPGAPVPRGFTLIVGTPGDDEFVGGLGGTQFAARGAGRDLVRGMGGNDVIHGGGGSDILCGGKGNDTLLGEGGKDKLVGGPGRNRVTQ